jgi:hypothetical protein
MTVSSPKTISKTGVFEMNFSTRSTWFLLLGVVVWLCAIGVGLRIVLEYENTPGSSAVSDKQWPSGSRIPRLAGLPTLVTVVHPHCPCSRATISELAVLMVRGQGLVDANVIFVRPRGFPEEWEKTDLWNSAAMIPGVRVWVDEGGIEAKRFGSRTSGQILLYSEQGELEFRGGITATRGHTGESAGRRSILALLTDGPAEQRATSVYGCPLFGTTKNNSTGDTCHAIDSK